VKSKRDSVGADKAIIVSNKGFTSTASTKARAYNIDIFSLAEALRNDWSHAFAHFQGFFIHSYGSALTVFIVDDGLRILNLHESVGKKVSEKQGAAYVGLNADGSEKLTLGQLVKPLFDEQKIKELIDSDTEKRHQIRVEFNVPDAESLFFLNETGEVTPLKKYIVVGQVWRQVTVCKPKVTQYKNEETGEIVAEIVGSDQPNFGFELIAEYPKRQDCERRVFLRKKKTG
ncbi:MAG: hypothetical protein IT583_03360, partial [Verrucomicrobia bacterium]|nr:hypothetical protein [Verrucomicrobiota bacterium]